jgi:isopentenyldiphosphate isomerase
MYILKTTKTISDMKFQESEISEIMFVAYEKFKKMVNEKQSDLLMHDEEFNILFDIIEKKN